MAEITEEVELGKIAPQKEWNGFGSKWFISQIAKHFHLFYGGKSTNVCFYCCKLNYSRQIEWLFVHKGFLLL